MEPLKLTSLRLSKKSLQRAEKIASSQMYCKPAEVLRVAIFLGLQICEKNQFNRLRNRVWESEMGEGDFDIALRWCPRLPNM